MNKIAGFSIHDEKGIFQGIHLEVQCKNSTALQCVTYCKKDGDFIEYGEYIERGTNTLKKNEYTDIVLNCKSEYEVLCNIPPVYCQWALKLWESRPRELVPFKGKFRPWQEWLLEKLSAPDDRTIYIVCDPVGKKGKTYFCKHARVNYGAYCSRPVKSADLKSRYRGENIVILDIPRTLDDKFMLAGAVEEFKDGFVTSGKYHGKEFIFDDEDKIGMCIFCNDRTGYMYTSYFSDDKIHFLYFKSDVDALCLEHDYKENVRYFLKKHPNSRSGNPYQYTIFNDVDPSAGVVCHFDQYYGNIVNDPL